MAAPIKTIVALDEGVDPRWIEEHFPSGSGIDLTDMVDVSRDGWERAADPRTDVLVVACAAQSEHALSFVSGAVREHPQRPVVMVSQASANGFVRRAFEAGADDIVVLPADTPGPSQDVLFAIQKAVARKSAPADHGGAQLGTMICVLGPKGGIGKTLTSCNLAVSLAEHSERVVLVDLDLQFGDLGLSLGLAPQRTSYDLATSGGSLDAEKIEGFLSTHPSGVKVLLAPSRPDQAGVVTVEFLREVYSVLRANYDFVIADTPPGFTPEVIASIDASSHIAMVGTLDALSLKNTKLGLETLDLMGYDRDRIRMVLNRADSNVGITHNDVVTITGRPPDVMVPSHRDITRSVNDGKPIALSAKKSEAAKAFHSLAAMYAQTQPSTSKTTRPARSLLARGRG